MTLRTFALSFDLVIQEERSTLDVPIGYGKLQSDPEPSLSAPYIFSSAISPSGQDSISWETCTGFEDKLYAAFANPSAVRQK